MNVPRSLLVLVPVVLLLSLPPRVLALTPSSPEKALEAFLDDVTLLATKDVSIGATVKSSFATLAGTSPATPIGSACTDESPDNLNLAGRIAWNRSVARCAEALGRVLKTEALRAEGERAVKLALFAAKMEEAAETGERQAQAREAEQKFLGYEWGVGFGASHSFDDVIDDASLVDGVIRANKEKTLLPRAVFEFHRLFFGHDNGKNGATVVRAHGPFAAVTATNDDLIGGFGLGWMIGWKDSAAPAASSAFTIGLGVMLDAEVKTLADGFEEDMPLPAGESAIRFKEKTRGSVLLLVTRTF